MGRILKNQNRVGEKFMTGDIPKKRCCICHEFKPITEYDTKQARCHPCNHAYGKEYRLKNRDKRHEYSKKHFQEHKTEEMARSLAWKHRSGQHKAYSENKECALYLGIIAERALSTFFAHIERMPMHNPGYDFICGKGFKIDVKSGCIIKGYKHWAFHIGHNAVADYFLCLGFDKRESLVPLHVWLIPGNVLNDHQTFSISNSQNSLSKWAQFEKNIGNVVNCCDKIKNGDV